MHCEIAALTLPAVKISVWMELSIGVISKGNIQCVSVFNTAFNTTDGDHSEPCKYICSINSSQ